jgi:hypothetical protein
VCLGARHAVEVEGSEAAGRSRDSRVERRAGGCPGRADMGNGHGPTWPHRELSSTVP